jgi:hypothetical protein
MTQTISTAKGLAIIGFCLVLGGLAAWGIEWPMRVLGIAGSIVEGVLIIVGLGILLAARRAKVRGSSPRTPAA